jgi:hypothetical protein
LIIPIRSWPDSTAKGTPKIMDIGLTPEAAQGLFFDFFFSVFMGSPCPVAGRTQNGRF